MPQRQANRSHVHGLQHKALTLLGSALLLSACQQGGLRPPSQPALPPANQTEQTEKDRQAEARKQAEQKIEQQALKQGWSRGHLATVACLHGERAQTDGNELRCEDQTYVERNYPAASSR